jgi:hypothetical protein
MPKIKNGMAIIHHTTHHCQGKNPSIMCMLLNKYLCSNAINVLKCGKCFVFLNKILHKECNSITLTPKQHIKNGELGISRLLQAR